VDPDLTEAQLDAAIQRALECWNKYRPKTRWYPFDLPAAETTRCAALLLLAIASGYDSSSCLAQRAVSTTGLGPGIPSQPLTQVSPFRQPVSARDSAAAAGR